MIRRSKTIKYLSNKELLKEIHKSKNSYCEFDNKSYEMYDMIIDSLDDVTEEVIQKAKENRAERLNEIWGDELFEKGYTNKQLAEAIKNEGKKATDIKTEDLVFRLMCNDHIPLVKNKKGEMVPTKVNFPAFQHHTISKGQFKCVGKSHFKDGKFNKDGGKITDKLAISFLKLIDRYGNRSNWRGYSWLEEMKGHATVRLCQVALQFNEAKSQNPFAWYTTVVNRSFTFVLNNEKESLSFKNKMNRSQGMEETFNEQAERDIENYYRDKGMESPYKKMIMNKPLGFYKKAAKLAKELPINQDDTIDLDL